MTAQEMRLAVFASPVTQADVAKHLGMDEAVVSKILTERRAMPEGFADRFTSAFDAAKAELKAKL